MHTMEPPNSEDHPHFVHVQIAARAAQTPTATAVIAGDQQWTYAELEQRVSHVTRILRACGVRLETVVGLCAECSIDLIAGLLAILRAGGVGLLLNPIGSDQHTEAVLADAQPEYILIQPHLVNRLPKHNAQLVPFNGQTAEPAEDADSDAVTLVDQNNAWLTYSLQSDRRPRVVTLTHYHLRHRCATLDTTLSDQTAGGWLVFGEMISHALLELLWPLTKGAIIILPPAAERQITTSGVLATTKPPSVAFSLFYFAADVVTPTLDKYELLLEGAKFADRHDFAAVWTPERHFHTFGGLYPNPSITGAAIAAITEHISIRAGSVVLPLHHPARVAEEWAVVDNLSHGRVGISFASGWHADDFIFAPDNYVDRRAITLHNVDAVRRLWRGETLYFRGGAGNEVAVRTLPRPIQPELPIWLTTFGNIESFQLAGELGVNILTHLLGQTIEELAAKIMAYRKTWQQHGHPGKGYVSLMLHTFVGNDLDTVREQVRKPFYAYLRNAIDLSTTLARSAGRNVRSEDLTDEDMEPLLAHAFARYFETNSLMGTIESSFRTIERMKAIGVDEIACLIDFGLEKDQVMESLHQLNIIRECSNTINAITSENASLPDLINRYQISYLQCTLPVVRILIQDPKILQAMQRLKKLILIGELPSASTAEQIRATLQIDVIFLSNM